MYSELISKYIFMYNEKTICIYFYIIFIFFHSLSCLKLCDKFFFFFKFIWTIKNRVKQESQYIAVESLILVYNITWTNLCALWPVGVEESGGDVRLLLVVSS